MSIENFIILAKQLGAYSDQLHLSDGFPILFIILRECISVGYLQARLTMVNDTKQFRLVLADIIQLQKDTHSCVNKMHHLSNDEIYRLITSNGGHTPSKNRKLFWPRSKGIVGMTLPMILTMHRRHASRFQIDWVTFLCIFCGL